MSLPARCGWGPCVEDEAHDFGGRPAGLAGRGGDGAETLVGLLEQGGVLGEAAEEGIQVGVGVAVAAAELASCRGA